MAAKKRTVKLSALKRIRGVAAGKSVRSLRNVRILPRGTTGTQQQRYTDKKGRRRPDGTITKPRGSAGGQLRRALRGAQTSPYRFRRTGAVGSRQG
jgi:hypothetical protein